MIKKTINYVKGSILEMKKVTWPSKKETINYTVLVVGVSVAIAAFLGGLDFIFQKGLEMFFLS
ncbi:preprotein translocase subunit SecE [Candidatus Parcubacteria bacterium]|nr:MAG: preprotein translocase subunit SecE [Candidatus Parcubacteria bacterium]